MWIEIFISFLEIIGCFSSPSSQRVWIEITPFLTSEGKSPRHPLHRGCGLKSDVGVDISTEDNVTLFTEGVD